MEELKKNARLRIKKRWIITLAIYLIAIVAASAIVLFRFGDGPGNVVLAGTGDNVSGWAWNSNIGWISMNCTDEGTCGTVNYGVTVDTGTGAFSGYAWSSNVGWINFGSAGNACPSAPSLDISTGAVTGYARIVSLGDDGCMKMSDDSLEVWDGNGVRFNFSTGELEGWAWNANGNGSGIGWVSFNCSNDSTCGAASYKVVLNSAPTAPAIGAIEELDGICKTVKVNWTDNSSGETGFVVEKSTDGSSWSSFCPTTPTAADMTSCTNVISPSTLYYFRVKAKGIIQDSAWSAGQKNISYCAAELEPVVSADANCDRIILNWTQEGSGVDHYEIWRDKDNAGFAMIQDNIAPATRTYTDADMESGSAYKYYIKTQNDGVDSDIVGPINPCPNLPTWKETGSR